MPSLTPVAASSFPPNLQDLFQLLLCVDHDDVGAAVIGNILAGLRGAGRVDAGDDATVRDPGGYVWAGTQPTPLSPDPRPTHPQPLAPESSDGQPGSSNTAALGRSGDSGSGGRAPGKRWDVGEGLGP